MFPPASGAPPASLGFASKHDALTGLDTGSGNDRFMGLDTGSGNDRFVGLDTGSGNDRFMGLDTGSGNDRLIGIDTGSGNDHIVHQVGSTSVPGGTTYFSGYSEAIGLDMNQGDPVTASISCEDGDIRLGQFGHEADHFTNFAMPVGDFI